MTLFSEVPEAANEQSSKVRHFESHSGHYDSLTILYPQSQPYGPDSFD